MGKAKAVKGALEAVTDAVKMAGGRVKLGALSFAH